MAALTPAAYVLESVLPIALEYKAQRTNRGKARQACIMAFHLIDYLKRHNQSVEAALRAVDEDAYEAVRSVANAGKHGETKDDRYPHKYQLVAGEEFPRPPAYLGSFMLGVSRLGDKHGDIIIGDRGNRAEVYVSLRAFLKAAQRAFPGDLAGVDFSVLDD